MTGILDLEADDILPRAAPVHCVADVSSPEVASLVARLGPWMPNLQSCAARAALGAAVEVHRPDVAILGRDFGADVFDTLARHVRTTKIGIVVLQPLREASPRFAALPSGATAIAEVEPIDPAAGLTEVVLRLRALVRRCRPLALSQRRGVGDLLLDEAALTLSMGAASAPIGLNDFRILGPMFDLPDHVWRREELLTIAFGSMASQNARFVDIYVSRTRRKLVGALGRDPVRTVRGVGYQLAFLP
ncbi:winged helix-turn-helix domain-containing protein [Roseicyclus sp.]|uniref:winged helix-turn-helix domain-containing protein n=1 Tax=Roseicyclus sp. TaxID=1914329 RepID=UPI003F9F8054